MANKRSGRYQLIHNGIRTTIYGDDLAQLRERAEYHQELFGGAYQIVDNRYGGIVYEVS